jgi:hypothetical protein
LKKKILSDAKEEEKVWIPIEGEGAKMVAGHSAHTLVNGGDGFLYLFRGSDGTQTLPPSSFCCFHLGNLRKRREKRKVKREKGKGKEIPIPYKTLFNIIESRRWEPIECHGFTPQHYDHTAVVYNSCMWVRSNLLSFS